ncbi:MAG: hypothetical protein V7688_05855 [Alcanivorax jadensis]|uniref:hypothetical protein n=1 Tax=Alcanivorax jadensis TaxID=64988 RepID=UPI003002BA8B
MSDRESRKKELLKELGDVQSLLDDTDTPPQRSPSESDTLDRMQIRKLASERSNPFLGTPPPPPQGNPAPAVTTPNPSAARPSLSNADIDVVIDELVAEALPKLEKSLRLRLRTALRKKS